MTLLEAGFSIEVALDVGAWGLGKERKLCLQPRAVLMLQNQSSPNFWVQS